MFRLYSGRKQFGDKSTKMSSTGNPSGAVFSDCTLWILSEINFVIYAETLLTFKVNFIYLRNAKSLAIAGFSVEHRSGRNKQEPCVNSETRPMCIHYPCCILSLSGKDISINVNVYFPVCFHASRNPPCIYPRGNTYRCVIDAESVSFGNRRHPNKTTGGKRIM